MKLGVVILLGFGVLFTAPQLEMPALTQFTDGNGPIFLHAVASDGAYS